MKALNLLVAILIIFGSTLFIQCDDPVSNASSVPHQYSSIQAAINSADNGEIILVSPGIYYENINFLGKSIIVKANGPAESVIIDGSKAVDPGNASVVKFKPGGENTVATIDGFTITGGTGSWHKPGKVGGGIWIVNARAIIKNCIIRNNSATKGGGVYCWSESDHSDEMSSLKNCVITDNDAPGGGSGININLLGSMEIDHCTIANNSIFIETAPAASISSFSNCIIWPATITTSYGPFEFNFSDVLGGWPSGVGNIDADPKFCDKQLANYHLASNSPCIGSGENNTSMGALGSCGLDYHVFSYPLEIGTTWKYKYDYRYSNAAIWQSRHGFHFWSVVDSTVNLTDFVSFKVSFKIESINSDTVSDGYASDSVTTLVNDTTYFFIDRGEDKIIVRLPSSTNSLIEDQIQGYFRGDQSVHIGNFQYGRFYQEGIGLLKMHNNNQTHTYYNELQVLIEFNGVQIVGNN